MISKLNHLKTRRGSLTNATVVQIAGQELLYSYQTLVGVWTGTTKYYTRDGLAASRTTGRHINLWLDGSTGQKVSEGELQVLVNK